MPNLCKTMEIDGNSSLLPIFYFHLLRIKSISQTFRMDDISTSWWDFHRFSSLPTNQPTFPSDLNCKAVSPGADADFCSSSPWTRRESSSPGPSRIVTGASTLVSPVTQRASYGSLHSPQRNGQFWLLETASDWWNFSVAYLSVGSLGSLYPMWLGWYLLWPVLVCEEDAD